jgi:hypothetical protein
MKYFFMFFITFNVLFANANESGVLYQGKSYVIFKDGKKVGEEPSLPRKPSSISPGNWIAIKYEIDEKNGVICYYNSDGSFSEMKTAPISCVKK